MSRDNVGFDYRFDDPADGRRLRVWLRRDPMSYGDRGGRLKGQVGVRARWVHRLAEILQEREAERREQRLDITNPVPYHPRRRPSSRIPLASVRIVGQAAPYRGRKDPALGFSAH